MQKTVVARAKRVPTLLLRGLNDQELAVRFWNIGGRSQFLLLLQRFRSEFLLSRSIKLDGLDWLLVAESQLDAVL
jgi:hypothetical protein